MGWRSVFEPRNIPKNGVSPLFLKGKAGAAPPPTGAGAVNGVAEIRLAQRHGTTRLAHLYERDPLRVLFPQPEAGEPVQAVIVTTSGGLVAGDRIDVAV